MFLNNLSIFMKPWSKSKSVSPKIITPTTQEPPTQKRKEIRLLLSFLSPYFSNYRKFPLKPTSN